MGLNRWDQHTRKIAGTRSENGHLSYFTEYFRWLDEHKPADPAERRITIIAKSPSSPVILTVDAMADELAARQVSVQVVFSDVDPERELHAAWKVIARLSKGRDHADLMRWASQSGILEAHEQMVMGRTMFWLGDAMRREPGRRDGFDLFETFADEKCSLGSKSFEAMWNFATPLPSWMLREASERRASASYAGPDHRALATLSFFRQLEKPDTLCH